MRLNEHIGFLIQEIEKERYPENKDAYTRIHEYTTEIRKSSSINEFIEVAKELENVYVMMSCYLPKKNFYDYYGSRSKDDNYWNYKNLAREKKRLLATLQKLKSAVESIMNAEIPDSDTKKD